MRSGAGETLLCGILSTRGTNVRYLSISAGSVGRISAMREAIKSSYGWTGRMLRVDLTSRRTTIEPTEHYSIGVIGGRGIGQSILFHEVEPEVDAFSAENKVILGAGPLVGTLAPASSRTSVETKNALNGGLCSSNFGGHIAAELKYAGYDGIIIEGAASEPSVLLVSDGEAKIESAIELWGKTTWETEEALISILGGRGWRVASIGPAGENLVRGATLIAERGRAQGRGGAGAVLGSKKLKAIAIIGSGGINVAYPTGFLNKVRQCWKKIDRSAVMSIYREGGTHLHSGAGGYSGEGAQPVRNYQDEYWPHEKTNKIREPVFRENFEVRRLACFNCPIYCSHFYRISRGPYTGIACEGVQTNTVRAFGSNLEIVEPNAILAAHAFCNQLGIDIDMASATIAWAFELYDRGILSSKDTDGLELCWGNHRVVLPLLHKIAYRKGFGELLADGVKHAGSSLGRGSEQYAMHVKGTDLNEVTMRFNMPWAFGIVTSSRGGGHLDGAVQQSFSDLDEKDMQEKFGMQIPGDSSLYAENAPLVVWFEKYKAAIDSLGMCYFTSYWLDTDLLSPEDYAELFSLATGEEMTGDDLLNAGERIHNIGKAFNTLHADFSRKDDYPPPRLVREPALSGCHQGAAIDLRKWDKMLDAYYEIHGWDKSSGKQTRNKLDALGLKAISAKLDEYGKFD
jgi:aldehyde:ferredoxin oxidoreductase